MLLLQKQQHRMLTQLEKYLGTGRVKTNVDLGPRSTFKLGGPAEFYFEAESDEDLINSVKAAHDLKIPYIILGGISNVVVGEEGIKGLVVKNLNSYKKLIEETESYVVLRVGSGYNMSRLAKETAESGYGGLEYQSGLPGSVGGGIAMNSGWYKHKPDKYVGDPVIQAFLVEEDGTTKTVNHDYFEFRYDHSIIKETHECIIWADFKLDKCPAAVLLQHAQDALDHRKKTQPYGVATSGCFFQNVDGVSAGKIIDEAGLKGFSIGGAQVSDVHANFIINTGDATPEDVSQLISHIKSVVKKTHNIDLHEEIVRL